VAIEVDTMVWGEAKVTSRGTFKPGTFVWFPAGEIIEHGAGPKQDMVALFISGALFRIDYVKK
jgi:hypothetical protein